MHFALDYDGTYTAAPELWDRFIADAQQQGHSVVAVTCRPGTPENVECVQVPYCVMFFTDRTSKRWYLERMGVQVDVWIDDDPATILNGM